MASPVRVRFAPSPTGSLHVGGARTALYNLLFARHTKGTFILRIEDTDVERSREELSQQILGAMSWLDLEYVEDAIRGLVEFPAEALDDFVLVRSDGHPLYHFCVCVDDADMNITHVIRGDDHLANTPKHVALFEALGADPPV